MKRNPTRAFTRFWTEVDRAEEYARQWGYLDWQPHYRDREYRPLARAYDAIRPFLRVLSRRRIFFVPFDALGMNLFAASSAHEALKSFLTPPDALFGQLRILGSAEYLEIKREAHEELELIQASFAKAGKRKAPCLQKKRGRPPATNARADKNIWDAWDSKRYKKYEDLASALGKTSQQVRHALDRHRKRIAKQAAAGKKSIPGPVN